MIISSKEVFWILARVGGFDGVSLQTFEYMNLLNELGVKVNIITGLEETKYGPIEYGENNKFLVKRLSLKHQDSIFLFTSSFKGESEIFDEWKNIFNKHKTEIKNEIKEILLKKNNSPVFIHNLISLRYMHPAAAIAIKEIIEEFPDKIFISFAPDSDWERLENLNMIRDDVKKIISSTTGDSLGPYIYDNLYYLILNNKQKEVFTKKYKVPKDRVFQIYDFLEFESSELKIPDKPKKKFLDYLAENMVYCENGKIKYKKCDLDKDTIFLLCPVRPVIRKKVKTSIFLAHQLKFQTRKSVGVVLTHPEEEGVDHGYLDRSVAFADRLGVGLIFLGNSLRLSNKEKKPDVWTLNDVYENIAALNSLGMVMSDKGGWENAINEILKAGIPIFINTELNSFNQIKNDMKIGVVGLSLTDYYKSFKKTNNSYTKNISEIKKFISWAKGYNTAHSAKRDKLVEYNYKKAYQNLSSEAVKDKIIDLLQKIGVEVAPTIPQQT